MSKLNKLRYVEIDIVWMENFATECSLNSFKVFRITLIQVDKFIFVT
jgi:hypothetical protein